MNRDRTLIGVVAAIVAAIVITALATTGGCANSPERREARRAAARETAAELAKCTVEGAVACGAPTGALIGCAIRGPEEGCGAERSAWSACYLQQAMTCGAPAAFAFGGILVHGAAGPAQPSEPSPSPCARLAVEQCVGYADRPDELRECFARTFTPCLEVDG